ncbi:uncharacterized protein LOC136040871 [Artemia franciscana]|uniref:uncharacterized protein LOC136040871 n=1 Tax=Artemia franciscana TaxID=6661 RepID=UPI0032DA24BE
MNPGHPVEQTLSGVAKLIEDIERLMDDKDTADVVFLIGKDEKQSFAHRTILKARCKSFQNLKRGDVCRISSAIVSFPSVAIQTSLPKIKLPNYTPEIFQNVLVYVYTGKITLFEGTVIEMMMLASEMGIEDLRGSCETFISSSLSVKNACFYLVKAIEIQDQSAGSSGAKCPLPFIEKCIGYIGENASECMKTEGFLNLPKDVLIRLISSDHLAIEEEEVWRAVLSWSKFQAKVTSPPQAWNREERSRMEVFLKGVINHVRLLLIDSQVFAEEVEPTGLVPIEVSLERYRFAALPTKFRENPVESRLKPRTSTRFFPGSTILSQNKTTLQKTLNAWYGSPNQQWRMVYKAGVHGFSSEAFHKQCDGVSPTYVIVQGGSGHICGGFSDIPWVKSGPKGRYGSSEKAFIFTLVNNENVPPTKFPVTKKMYAVCFHHDCGPIFGAGSDLYIASNAHENMESYTNFPHSYNGDETSPTLLMGDYNFSIADYEVFTPATN